jgi:hypothetical protein
MKELQLELGGLDRLVAGRPQFGLTLTKDVLGSFPLGDVLGYPKQASRPV